MPEPGTEPTSATPAASSVVVVIVLGEIAGPAPRGEAVQTFTVLARPDLLVEVRLQIEPRAPEPTGPAVAAAASPTAAAEAVITDKVITEHVITENVIAEKVIAEPAIRAAEASGSADGSAAPAAPVLSQRTEPPRNIREPGPESTGAAGRPAGHEPPQNAGPARPRVPAQRAPGESPPRNAGSQRGGPDRPQPAGGEPDLGPVDASGAPLLTSQQLRVAGYVRDGMSNRQIGQRMFISEHTVAYHLRRIFKILGLESRFELKQWMRALRGSSDGGFAE